ncbi:unnamed protein product [Amoebophrya sp. A25]|nr:unnamed protein product [Amoebophrya sp. A25]|eukprot:GSA25T00010733001.1
MLVSTHMQLEERERQTARAKGGKSVRMTAPRVPSVRAQTTRPLVSSAQGTLLRDMEQQEQHLRPSTPTSPREQYQSAHQGAAVVGSLQQPAQELSPRSYGWGSFFGGGLIARWFGGGQQEQGQATGKAGPSSSPPPLGQEDHPSNLSPKALAVRALMARKAAAAASGGGGAHAPFPPAGGGWAGGGAHAPFPPAGGGSGGEQHDGFHGVSKAPLSPKALAVRAAMARKTAAGPVLVGPLKNAGGQWFALPPGAANSSPGAGSSQKGQGKRPTSARQTGTGGRGGPTSTRAAGASVTSGSGAGGNTFVLAPLPGDKDHAGDGNENSMGMWNRSPSVVAAFAAEKHAARAVAQPGAFAASRHAQQDGAENRRVRMAGATVREKEEETKYVAELRETLRREAESKILRQETVRGSWMAEQSMKTNIKKNQRRKIRFE